MMQQFRPGGFSMLPMVVKNLLIINGLFFLGTLALGSSIEFDMVKIFGLHYPESHNFGIWQLVTYMFMHGGFAHVFFNMFALWMFGNVLENVWGPKRFLNYYLITGIGAGLIHLLVTYIRISIVLPDLTAAQIETVYHPSVEFLNNIYRKIRMANEGYEVNFNLTEQMYNLINTPTVGASGAVFGILLAFGMMFPNSLIYIYFAIPIKAKYFVMIYGALELYSGIADNPGDNVAHFAHLGGMIFGYFIILYWKKKGTLSQ